MNTGMNNIRSIPGSSCLSASHAEDAVHKAAGDPQSSAGKSSWLRSSLVRTEARRAGLSLYEILGVAELMRVAYEKDELESLQQRLAILQSDAAELSSSLSNIIELSRLEAEPVEMTMQRFDVVAMLHDVAQTARAAIGQKPVRVMDVPAPGPVFFVSDPGKVRRIMTELANNAAKFTDRGRIALILNRDDDRVRITVTDTGKGMNTGQIANLMEPGEGPTGEIPADAHPGMGLTIVKYLIAALEGAITVSSKIGEGTIIEVTLPCGERPAVPVTIGSGEPAPNHGR